MFASLCATAGRDLPRMTNLMLPALTALLAVVDAPATAAPSAPSGMWALSLPWWEFIIRAVIVYVFLLGLLRVTGKRQIGQLAPFDLVLLLVLSNAVQNAMNGGDNSIGGGLISALTLVLLNHFVGIATFRSRRLEGFLEGRPEVLIHDGKIDHKMMERAQLTHHELNAALRQAGCLCPEEVHTAMLENNGAISVVPKSRAG
ncbi:MAG: YetF domain-containing protein [Chthoniobacteraceae bacterium]